MTTNKPVDKLADNLKGLVIGASGPIPGYQHGMSSNLREVTHIWRGIERKREREAVPRYYLMSDTVI